MNNHTAQLLAQHFDTAFAAPGGIKKLRELILTLAMQGRLVAQDPNDLPASELHKKIEEEKRRLVKEGKIKAPKPLPEIKPREVPYELPEGWKWVRLIEIGSWAIGSGFPHSIQGNQDQEIFMCKVSDMNLSGNEKFIETVNNTISKELAIETKINIHEPGTIIFPKIGGAIATNKRRVLSRRTAIDNNCLGIKPYSLIDLEWTYQLLLSFDFSLYQSGTSVPAISQGVIGEIVIGLPPLPEQHRIVAKIDQLMARCNELEKLRTEREQKRLAIHTAALRQLLDAQEQDNSANAWQFLSRHFSELYSVKENVAELRKAILQLAVMGKLVPQDPNDPSANELLKRIAAERQRLVKEKKIKVTNPLLKINVEEEPFALPEGWVWCRFQDVFISIKYGTSKKCEYNGGLVPVLRIPNISNGSVLLDDLKSTDLGSKEVADLSLEKHDILIIRSNGSVSLVGRSAVVDNNAVGFSYAGYLMRIRVFKNQVSSNYLHNVLQSPMTRVAIEGPIRTTSGVKNVNSTEISQLKIPLPPIPEQNRIVAKIDQLMARCDTLDQQIDATTGKKTELLCAFMASI